MRRLAEYTLGKERTRTETWNVAAEEYLAEVGTQVRPRTRQSYEYALGKHFKYGQTKAFRPQAL